MLLACMLMLGGCGSGTEKIRTALPDEVRGLKGKVEQVIFTESNRKLNNPNRGFYQLYEFKITDEGMDYREFIEEWYPEISDIQLMFVQVNLQEYRQGAITGQGLDQIETLFSVLETYNKQLIVRFVYDREGKIKRYEPKSLETILEHMEQLGPVLRKHSKRIFVVQGVFTGNWGEMNGSQYDTEENWRILAAKLAQVTDESTYLGVRTPVQWRTLISPEQVPEGEVSFATQALIAGTGLVEEAENAQGPAPGMGEGSGAESSREAESAQGGPDTGGGGKNPSLWGRLGLFNDGMFGNETDYGTYGEKPVEDALWTDSWRREDELAFQNQVCRLAPNGGETITDNGYNDLPGVLKDLAAMHVTYLNKWYDPAVLEKWAGTVIEEEGCFDGMDGYTYVERHLGYRLLIDSAQIRYRRREKTLSVVIHMKNKGFAPIYKAPQLKLFLRKEGTEEEPLAYDIQGELNRLTGGTESETVLSLEKEIVLEQVPEGKYEIFFAAVDPDTQSRIQMANDQNQELLGYCLGSVEWNPLEFPVS